MTVRFVLCALAVLWVVPNRAQAESGGARLVAIVTEVEGSARFTVRGRSATPDVAETVQRGTVIVLERGAKIVLTFPIQESIYELRGPGRFIVHRDGVQLGAGSGRLARRDLIPALRALQIHPDGATLQGSAAMRGATARELEAEGPSGTQLTRDPIRICWKSLGAQWMYRVRLIDDDGVVLFETRTTDSTVELPATLQLQPTAPYLWHVQATAPNGHSTDAAGEFQRLDPESEQALLYAESVAPELDATGRMLIRIARQQRGFLPDGAGRCSREGALSASRPEASK
jgi:hypothetical protein